MTEESDRTEPGSREENGTGLLPELDFTSFILSLSSSALMTLGVIENPVTGQKEKDTAVARQTIDLIALLKEKTAGNLSDAEGKLIDDALAELQVWYTKETA